MKLASLLLALALAASACAGSSTTADRADGSTTTTSLPAEVDTTPAPSTTTAPATPGPTLAWTSCTGGQCATLAVPRDHADPDGPSIDVHVFRQPATGDRIGALFVNFGGPGAGAASILRRFPIPSGIRERFDIVATDPRGVEQSTPLQCGLPATTLYGVDPTIEDAADAAALVDISRRYADDCAGRRGDLLPHLGTFAVARDMDAIRAAMGDDRLNFLGFSYGTVIGQAYADLFPARVRTMILDGVVDTAPAGIDVAREQALGFETALANWAAACGSRSTCTFEDPVAAVDAMLAAAETGVPSRSGARDLGPGEAAVGLARPLYSQQLWDDLDGAVAGALAGDGSGMVALADQYARIVDFSIYFAVSCLDNVWPATAEEFFAAGKRVAEVAPRFGEAIVNDYVRCVYWPVTPTPIGPVTGSGAAPILVVSTTGDPATPYENGVIVASRLTSGVLLTYKGEGHTITFQGSPCVDRVAFDYLVDGNPPPDGDVC